MEKTIETIEQIYNAIDQSLIREVLEPKIGLTMKEHLQTLKNMGIEGDDLIAAMTSIAVVESINASTYIAAILASVNLDEPFDPRDFIHLVK